VVAHPRNRSFVREGPEWEAWVEDLRLHGIKSELEVRELGDGRKQIIKGHRRHAGWGELAARFPKEERFRWVPVICKEMTDEEALFELLRDNLLHEELDAVQEAEAVEALRADLGISLEDIAGRLNKSLTWVRTRQLVLNLPEEAKVALKRAREDDRHLHIGTVQLLLDLRPEEIPLAVQMVLHPEFDLRTLSPRQAADAIAEVIVKPRREKEAWEAGREKLGKAWRASLRKLALKGTRDEVLVTVVRWDDLPSLRPGKEAEAAVPAEELSEAAPEGLLWLHLAVRHGVAVRVRPDPANGELVRAEVDEVLVRQAEAALAEAGGVAWILGKRRVGSGKCEVGSEQPEGGVVSGKCEVGSEQPPDGGAVSRALADIDGEPDPAWVAEELSRPEAVVVEQSMERTTAIRMEEVVRLRAEAQAWLDRPLTLEELTSKESADERDRQHEEMLSRWPEWAKRDHLFLEDVVDVCDWVLSLKYMPDPKA